MRINFAQDIREAVTMLDLACAYGLEPSRSGFIRCPFHAEKTASCKLYDGGRGFSCYGCGEHGSVIDFVMKYFNLDFAAACAKINADFALGLPIGRPLSMRERKKIRKKITERQMETSRQDILEAKYWQAFDLWKWCVDIIEKYTPKERDEAFDPRFVAMCKARPGLESEMEDAAWAMLNHSYRNGIRTIICP